MPYTLERSLERPLITIRRVGIVTYQEIKASLEEVDRKIVSTIKFHLLVDIRGTTQYPNKADLLLVADTNCRQTRLSKRTAFVTNDETYESIKFFASVASYRGYSVQLFSDEVPAVDWLFGSPKGPPPSV